MTQFFDEKGNVIPVTIIKAGPCEIAQIKTQEKDGYNALQLGLILQKNSKKKKQKNLKEFRLENFEELNSYIEKKIIDTSIFNPGDLVNVTGYGIGRGFSGYQKRHHFARGPMTHGSKNHRLPGSIGAGTTPGRVFPGTKMAGRKGSNKVTIRNLTIVQIETEQNLIILKGSIPGKNGALINIYLK
uniref:Large ribosomal subunit protein uL3c n=1 Tax=Cyanoptyche gloeocystis TaxID=77922 RepID=A0A3G1IWK2_9EUKA|nr:ribosomal protein L13 [Cyanoptyche gloeocystis]